MQMKFTNAASCATLAAISLLDAGLTLFIAWKYAYDAATWIEAMLAALTLLVLAAGLATICRFSKHVDCSPIVWWAVIVGLILGALWVFEILTNNVLAPPLPARDIIDNSFWAAIELITLAGAFAMALRSRRVVHGVAFGAWSGLASGLIACTAALALVTFGMRLLTTDPLNVAEWATRGGPSGVSSIERYFAFETLAGALGHLLVLGVGLGTLVGLLGGWIAVLATRLTPRASQAIESPPNKADR